MAKTEEKPLEKQIVERQGVLEKGREEFDNLSKECTALSYPRRSDYEDTEKTGQKRAVDVYDGTAISALNIWADGLYGYHISPAIRWFATKLPERQLNEIDEVREWLQECDEELAFAYQRSNFYENSCLGIWLRDGGAIGTATMFANEIIDEEIVGFLVPHPRGIYLANDPYGRVNLLHHKFKLTTRQITEKFTKAEQAELNDPTKFDIEHKKNFAVEREFIHAIFPNDDRFIGALGNTNMPYLSVYVQVDGPKLIRKSGINIFPAVWRPAMPSNKPYGYGLVGDAIITIYTANQLADTMLGAAQLSVEKPKWIPQEMKGKTDFRPGGHNYYDDPLREIKAIDERINYPIGVDREERVQKQVRDNFKVDFFLMLAEAAKENRNLTATQVIEMQGEKAALMGPQLGTLNNVLQQIHRTVFEIEYTAGRLPIAPAIVQDYSEGRINVDFVGPLAQAQKRLFKTQGIRHSLESIGPLVEAQVAAQQPATVLDKIDMDKTAEELMESHGMPEKCMRSDEEVEDIRTARAQQEQAQRLIETAGAAADAVPKVSKKVEEGSVLAEMMK